MYILYRYKHVPTVSVFIVQRLKYYNCYKYFLGLYGIVGTRLHSYDIGTYKLLVIRYGRYTRGE